MDRTTNIEERVRAVIAEQLGIARQGILPTHKLGEDLGADSLDKVEIVMAIEDEFEIGMTDEEADSFNTVGSIIEYLDKKVGK